MKYFAFGSNLNEEDLKKWCDDKSEKIPNLLNPQIKKLENYYLLCFTRYVSTNSSITSSIEVNSPV